VGGGCRPHGRHRPGRGRAHVRDPPTGAAAMTAPPRFVTSWPPICCWSTGSWPTGSAGGPAAAIDSQVLAIELRGHPRLADQLRVIGAFGPSTIQPVVAARRLPTRLKDQVREIMVGLAGDPAARPVLVYGLVVVAEPPTSGTSAAEDHQLRGMHEATNRLPALLLEESQVPSDGVPATSCTGRAWADAGQGFAEDRQGGRCHCLAAAVAAAST
jgi:hypothetical protein